MHKRYSVSIKPIGFLALSTLVICAFLLYGNYKITGKFVHNPFSSENEEIAKSHCTNSATDYFQSVDTMVNGYRISSNNLNIINRRAITNHYGVIYFQTSNDSYLRATYTCSFINNELNNVSYEIFDDADEAKESLEKYLKTAIKDPMEWEKEFGKPEYL